MKYHITIGEAMSKLREENKTFSVMMHDGDMKIEYFVPKNADTQQPHKQDEIYVIVKGASDFYRNGEMIRCAAGDVIFVPAKMEHRFINFSDDFAAWVIFYGEKR